MSSSQAITEVLESIDNKTTQILEHVETIGKQVADIGTQWELCEIAWREGPRRGLMGRTLEFYAAINGPRGTYAGIFSGTVKENMQTVGGVLIPRQAREAEAAVHALSRSLASRGWQAYDVGRF